MANGGRFPGTIGLLGLILLVVPIGVTAWWLTRPTPERLPPGPSLDELDIVCIGRVDAAGLVTALAPNQPGRVVRIAVAEGAQVQQGDEILAIDDTQYRLSLEEAQAAVLAAQVEVDVAALKARQFPQQIALKAKQIEALQADAEAGDKRLAQMRDQQMLTSAVTSADVAVFEANVRKLHLAVAAAKIEFDDLQKVDPNLEVRVAQARLDMANTALKRAETAVRDCVLRAPTDGTVLRLQASIGGLLAPSAAPLPGSTPPPVVFAPSGPLVVRAELEQSDLARVEVGMPAIIKDDIRIDSPVWTGRVERIAGWVAPRRTILLEPGELNDVRTTEVVIGLDPTPDPLWIGQRMQVRFVRGK
jgi:multidrug resistance efflux pump